MILLLVSGSNPGQNEAGLGTGGKSETQKNTAQKKRQQGSQKLRRKTCNVPPRQLHPRWLCVPNPQRLRVHYSRGAVWSVVLAPSPSPSFGADLSAVCVASGGEQIQNARPF